MTPAPQHAPPLPDAAADASAALARAIAARPAWTVPCRAAADPAPWTSDDPDDAAWAMAECGACPLLDLCERFGIESRAVGVVLAGRRWYPGTPARLKTSPAPAGANRKDTTT